MLITCLCICLSVCVSVCPRAYLWNRWTDLREILFADPSWPWLDPPAHCATLCTSGFMDDVTLDCSGPYEHAQT